MKNFLFLLKRRIDLILQGFGLREPDKIMYIGGGETLPAPPTREEELRLLQAVEKGDSTARGELIERNLRLVVYIARRFDNTGVNMEDLISIGTIG